jgi:hypothetical protein
VRSLRPDKALQVQSAGRQRRPTFAPVAGRLLPCDRMPTLLLRPFQETALLIHSANPKVGRVRNRGIDPRLTVDITGVRTFGDSQNSYNGERAVSSNDPRMQFRSLYRMAQYRNRGCLRCRVKQKIELALFGHQGLKNTYSVYMVSIPLIDAGVCVSPDSPSRAPPTPSPEAYQHLGSSQIPGFHVAISMGQ